VSFLFFKPTFDLICLFSLPTEAALLAPGTRDGQTKLVRDGGEVICYNWSAEQNMWIKIGPVVGAKKPTEGRTLYEGQVKNIFFV